MRRDRSPRITFQPTAQRSIQTGADLVVNSIRPTLGPLARTVAIDRKLIGKIPEILDGGAPIAQAIAQLQDPHQDIGAMLVRELVASVNEQVSDGTATAAVIFQRLLHEGLRYVTAGGESVTLRHHLLEGSEQILASLAAQAQPVETEEELVHLAETLCHDSEMARLIGEILSIVGEYGRVEVRAARDRGLEREYVEGMYWDRGVVARWMLPTEGEAKLEFTESSILISDLDISEPLQLLPVIEAAVRTNMGSLLLVVGSISDSALSFLKANINPESFRCAVVKTPGWGKVQQAEALADLAVLTGGRPLVGAAGDTVAAMDMADFGSARRIWANQKSFGIVAGGGDPRQTRQHLSGLRSSLQASTDRVDQDRYRARIGKLMGGSATLWVGGVTEIDIEERLARAKRTLGAVRSAMLDGVVLGGGIALQSCRASLARTRDEVSDPDAVAAYRILDQALSEPLRAIVSNSGLDRSQALARLSRAPAGSGLDVRTGKVVGMAKAGILDSTAVVQAAVRTAISSAAIALSIEALVLSSRNSATGPAQGNGKAT